MFNYEIKSCLFESDFAILKSLLIKEGLSFDTYVTESFLLYDQNLPIATFSLYHHVIKMIAIKDSYQGQNITTYIMNYLTSYLTEKGIFKYFLFTKPSQKYIFDALDFKLILETQEVLFYENKYQSIEDTLNDLKRQIDLPLNDVGSIVMNCNPITNGHLYLIEKASKNHETLLIFLVEENESVFSFDVRYQLIKEATKHLSNVRILLSTKYIISKATFPSYFMKDINTHTHAYMHLDIQVFIAYFMKTFNISKRYVGEEPLDPMTHLYNETMHQLLGKKLEIIPRLSNNHQVISASYIRQLAKNKAFDEIKLLVPKPTYDYLISKEGQALWT